jgi:SAM-dependent methyltransferase
MMSARMDKRYRAIPGRSRRHLITWSPMTSQTAPDHWNHNVRYQPAVLGAVPPVCGAALDVGCAEVTGIDPDAPMIAQAQQRAKASAAGNVTFVAADFLAYPFADGSFDFACAASPRRPARSRRPGRRQVGRRSAGRRGRHPGRALPPGNPAEGRPGRHAHRGPGSELARGPRRREPGAAWHPLPPPPVVALLIAVAQASRLSRAG